MGNLFNFSGQRIDHKAQLEKIEELKKEIENNFPNFPVLNICVAGVHNAGKSAWINTFLRWYNNEYKKKPQPGEYSPVGSGGQNPTTHEILMFETDDKKIRLFDVPGLQVKFEDDWVAMITTILKTGLIPGKVLDYQTIKLIPTQNNVSYRCDVLVFIETLRSLEEEGFIRATKEAVKHITMHSRTPFCVITNRKEIKEKNKLEEYTKKACEILNTKQVYCVDNIIVYNAESSSRDLQTENQLNLLLHALYDAAKRRIIAEGITSGGSKEEVKKERKITTNIVDGNVDLDDDDDDENKD